MAELFETVKIWFLSLGENYGVNPIIFGSIYVGAIPFFTLSIGWIVRNYKKGKTIILPSLSATFFFISAYLYLIVAGRNVPDWVYLVVVAMVGVGAYSTINKVRGKIEQVDSPADD